MPKPIKVTGSAHFRKSQKRQPMPLLPGDMAILRQVERERKLQREKAAPQEQLEYLGPLRGFSPLDKPLKRNEVPDIDIVVRKILEHMWQPFPKNDDGRYTIYHRTLAETAEARGEMPRAVLLSHLYGVFSTSTTRVDQQVKQAAADGRVRLLTVNLPDSMDLVMNSEDFYSLCEKENPELAQACRLDPQATWFDADSLAGQGVDVDKAISQGFLTINTGRSGVRVLTFPGQGRLIKLAGQARAWLLKTMVQSNRKFKEMPEYLITEKLQAHKGYWTQLRGVTLEWILYDAVGGGWIDGFETPMGRGWKVLKT